MFDLVIAFIYSLCALGALMFVIGLVEYLTGWRLFGTAEGFFDLIKKKWRG